MTCEWCSVLTSTVQTADAKILMGMIVNGLVNLLICTAFGVVLVFSVCISTLYTSEGRKTPRLFYVSAWGIQEVTVIIALTSLWNTLSKRSYYITKRSLLFKTSDFWARRLMQCLSCSVGLLNVTLDQVLGSWLSSPFQLPANSHPGMQQMIAQVSGALSPVWDWVFGIWLGCG